MDNTFAIAYSTGRFVKTKKTKTKKDRVSLVQACFKLLGIVRPQPSSALELQV